MCYFLYVVIGILVIHVVMFGGGGAGLSVVRYPSDYEGQRKARGRRSQQGGGGGGGEALAVAPGQLSCFLFSP